MAIELHDNLKILTNKPEIAFQYQDDASTPWSSIAGAHNGVPEAYRAKGKIRFIDQGDGKGVIEYWYSGGIELENLVPRYENLESASAYIEQLEGIKLNAETILEQTNYVKSEVEVLANNVNLGLIPKGSWNPSTNTPAITGTPNPDWADGSYLDITPVSGTLSFAGENFLIGQQVNSGDKIKKIGNQWSLVKFSIGQKSVGLNELSDGAVSFNKTNFFTPGKNLFNILDTENILNGYVDSATGLVTNSVAHRTTHYIAVAPGENIFYSSGSINGARVAYYNQNKGFVSGILLGAGGVVPAGCYYIRASINTSVQSWESFQVERGTIKTPWETFKLNLTTSSGIPITANRSEQSEVANDLNPLLQINRKSIGYSLGKNLASKYDKNVLIGSFIQFDNGIQAISASYNSTGFIDVVAGNQYTLSYKHQIAWYNSNKVYISGSNSSDSNKTQTAPAGAAFLRCSVAVASWALFQVELGSTQTAYEDYTFYIDGFQGSFVTAKRADLASLASVANSLIPGFALTPENLRLIQGKNLFNINASDNETGKFISAGVATVNPSYNATGFIPVTAGSTYTLSYKHSIAWYNSSKVYISQSASSDTNKTQTAPAGAAFLRCSVNILEWPLFQVELGTVRTKYEPFAYVLDKINAVPVIAANLSTNDIITAPAIAPKIYVPRGKELTINSENLYKNYESDGKSRTEITLTGVSASEMTITDRGTKYKQGAGNASLAVINSSLKTYNKDYDLLNSLAFAIQPVNETLTTPKNIMNIGDSYTLRETFINSLLAGSSVSGANFCGMRKSTASSAIVNHEGRGGWSMNTYHTAQTALFTPFVQPQAPYKYFGNTSYWINAVNNPVIGSNNENYDWGNIDPAIRALYSGSTGLLITPAANDVMYVNSDSVYKRWDGSAWVVVTGLTWSFNFGKYRSLYSCPMIDIAHTLLGTNDFAGNAPRDFNLLYYYYKQQMDNMIASMKLDNPAIKIIVGIPVSSGRQGSYGTYLTERRKINYWMLAKSLIADYGNRESDGIILADYHSTVDRLYGYDPQKVIPFSQYTGPERELFMSDFVHLSTDGFKQMGDVYMGAIQSLR